MDESDLQPIFETEFARPASTVEARAATAVMGAEFPAELQTYSWVSRTELRQVVDALAEVAPRRLVDVGCGRGGVGLWIARKTGARLTGLDIAESALESGRRLAEELGIAAAFRQGSFEETSLPDEFADAIVSFDAFLFTHDKQAAFRELQRVLRPGGRLVMTSWDYHSQPPNRPPQVEDHRPAAEAVGLVVRSYDDMVDWYERCAGFADHLLAHVDEAAAESGGDVEELRTALITMRATVDCMSRRFLLVADRPN